MLYVSQVLDRKTCREFDIGKKQYTVQAYVWFFKSINMLILFLLIPTKCGGGWPVDPFVGRH